MTNDLKLIQRIRKGDRAALGELYARYLPAVWRFVMAHLWPHDSTAKDVVSETFLAAIHGIGDLDIAKGSVAAWLMGVARHKIADYRRRPFLTSEGIDNADSNSGPEQSLAQEEARISVRQIMLAMEEEHRLALEWKYLEEISVRDIAQRLGRTEKAAEALLFRAREEFRKQFQSLIPWETSNDT